MPELPEVETVRRGLEPNIKGKKINDIILRRKDIRIPIPEDLSESFSGNIIKSVGRRSKYLLLDAGLEDYLIIHLGMSGKLLYHAEENTDYLKHDHVIINFEDKSSIVFNDARRFGLVTTANIAELGEHKLFKHLGPEPLTGDFTAEYLKNKFKKKNVAIKQAIMDSKNLVGVGNIYAAESLFRSKINPITPANKVSFPKLKLLTENIKQVLEAAIESGGSTLRDYVRSDGDVGYFQHNFNVYGKENEPCLICATNIKRIVQQGRSTFYCPKCQKT